MNTPLIDGIKNIENFRRIPQQNLDELAREIREFLVEKVSRTGGHIASNLGVVELTIALHKVFDTPRDKIVFDVGHQTYVSKILSGRADEFDTLRKKDGLSGFPKRSESEFDVFNTGHSSTSVSAALGLLRAMRHKGDKSSVAAVIGDGALTGGMAFEALNDAGESGLPLIVILNDNEMSISRNVGALTRHLGEMRSSSGYRSFKKNLSVFLSKIPKLGPRIRVRLSRLKSRIKYFLLPNVLFEELGFTYLGPVDGHDINKLIETITMARNMEEPVLLHVITRKGRGYKPAETEPGKFHGIGPFAPETGEEIKKNITSNSAIAGQAVCRIAERDRDVAVVTAAMSTGTGMEEFKKRYSDRFFDVGIAEQHAVTMAAGLACGGMKPIAAIYSSFMQRAYDQMLHDVALQRLPVVFALDRAGLVGADGETHQGVYDIAYVLTMPYVDIYSPASAGELEQMLEMAVNKGNPAVVRYGRGLLPDAEYPHIEYGKWLEINPISDVTVIASGRMVETAKRAAEATGAGLVSARFIRPMDEDMLRRIGEKTRIIITIEDGIASGGMGSRIAEWFSGSVKVIRLGVGEEPVKQASVEEQDILCGMDCESLKKVISMAMEEI
ncbi:MAG: 1-deoxy-D-xylulose-5-phosphate synthase [Clostridia bacterium]|nr:1-deoxy-D-xylulose-5-phosphate synthase [Clostridia bacterium]